MSAVHPTIGRKTRILEPAEGRAQHRRANRCKKLGYSIVSLMRMSSDSGISMPSAPAVLRLTMSSTLTACCRQVGGLVAFEETAGKGAGLAIGVGHARSVAHESAGGYIFAIIIDRRQCILRGQSSKYCTLAIEERIGADHQCSDPPL